MWRRVDEVFIPVCRVAGGELRGMEDQQDILGIARLGRLGEVEAPGDDRLPVDHHHLVVGDPVGRVDEGRDPLVDEVSRPGIPLRPLAFVQDHPDVDTPFFGLDQRLGDRNGSEAVRLDQNRLSGAIQGIHHGLRASPVGTEIGL